MKGAKEPKDPVSPLSSWRGLLLSEARPFLPIALSLILGILIFSHLPLPLSGTKVSWLFALTAAGFLVVALCRQRIRTVNLLIASFFFGGALVITLVNPVLPQEHIRNFVTEEGDRLTTVIEGRLTRVEERSRGLIRFYVELESAKYAGVKKTTSGRVRLNLRGSAKTLGRGDRIRARVRLQLPRNLSNPGEFDYEWWLARKGILVTGYVMKKRGVLDIELLDKRGSTSVVYGLSNKIRAGIGQRIDQNLNESGRAGGLLKALVIGERGEVSPATREVFQRTGTAHILAISGLHIGIVAFLSYSLFFNLFRLSERAMLALNIKKLSALLSLFPVLFYASLTSMSVSTERAVIMVGVFVFVYITDRGRDLINVLALAAVVLLILSPGSLWDVSFQLSFGAVLGIVLMAPRFASSLKREDEWAFMERRGRFSRFIDKPLGIFFVTLAATIATAPLVLFYFNNISLVGLFTNLFVVPLVGFVAVPLALVSVLFMPFSETLSALFLTLSGVLLEGVVTVLEPISKFEYSSFKVSTPSLISIFSFYIFVAALLYVRRARLWLYIAAISFLVLLASTLMPFKQASSEELRVTFLSVGQGDATFVEFPSGETMLVDGGPAYTGFDMGRVAVAPFLWKKGIKKVDYVVMTHAQMDHMGGLKFVVENFSPREFWWNGVGGLEELKGLGVVLTDTNTKLKVKGYGSEPIVVGGVVVEFLSPALNSGSLRGMADVNEDSLVMRLVYDRRSVLLTGDIGIKTEQGLMRTLEQGLNADVLKAAHHGSRTSSDQAFLSQVSPEYVVVSVGYKNRFGFPHPEIARRYIDADAKILRTDRDGAVTILTNGKGLKVKTYLTGGETRSILKVSHMKE